jgi:membrane protease YdiL (CAAX protease family)
MKFGTFRQQMGFTFCLVSAFVSVIGDYLWAYHFASFERKFPTPWSVFQLRLEISVVVVWVSVSLFILPMLAVAHLKTARPFISDHREAAFLACIVQSLIFISPHLFKGSSLFLPVLFVTPLSAGAVLSYRRRRLQGIEEAAVL